MIGSLLGGIAGIAGGVMNLGSANDAAKMAKNLKYERIDLDSLQERARTAAFENAANSIQLERDLAPGVARTRDVLQTQVAEGLERGGALDADIANQVTNSAITGANSAGFQGAAGPATAAMLGLTAMGVKNQRQNAASNLLAANPLPESGLSPGAIASAQIADTNAANQFAISKLQAQQNAAMGQQSATSGLMGSVASTLGSVFGGK